MNVLIQEWRRKATKLESVNADFLTQLKFENGRQVDQHVVKLHEEVFEEIDCLECGNCCKKSSPILRNPDIKRIAKSLNMKTKAFMQKYLKKDEDGDWVTKSRPCPFLGQDNRCSIYAIRPEDCADFPHTHKKGFNSRRYMHTQNTILCPAVFHIVERLKAVMS